MQFRCNSDSILCNLSTFKMQSSFNFDAISMQPTGCSLETVKNYLLINQATKQPISWDRCLFVHQICTFWYLVSKNFNSYSVIFNLRRLWRCKTLEICKIHRKLMNFISQYCFANISATKASIFMKFETYNDKIVKN